MLRRAKIICTIGPASSDAETIARLIAAGMDVARLNFSHGTHEDHARALATIRAAAAESGKPIGILQDLQGPKIRTGAVRDGGVRIDDGSSLVITADDIPIGDASRVGTTYPDLPRDVQPGQTILLDDGYLILRIERVSGNDVVTRVIKGGVLKDHKGIIVPGAHISAPALSGKDIADMRFGLEQGVDAVAMSFVSSERDIIELKTAMKVFGRVVPVIAKIERAEGIDDIDDIIREADGIMVARGDMGLELPAEQVPVLQKRIIARCNYYGKPVITATQMLESMIENPRPTRAEASDVANAVLDGTDCVMLSGETSVGAYPVEAVETMARIIETTEANGLPPSPQHDTPADTLHNVADAVGRAAGVIASQIRAGLIVPLTSSGGTAKIIAKYRPSTPILALTDNVETLRRLTFVWGITARLIPPLVHLADISSSVSEAVLATGMARRGDLVVVSAGAPLSARVPTNMLKVEVV